MSLTRELAAQALGMKVREIVDIQHHRDGDLVTTHDGQVTVVDRDGTVRPRPAGPASAGVSVQIEAEPAKPAKKATSKRSKKLEAEPSAPAPLEVPDATPEEVLAWVGEDAARAAAALAAEEDRDEPREELIEALEKLA